MIKKISLHLCFLTITAVSFCKVNFNELLKCNLSNTDIASICSPSQELALYKEALEKEQNYPDSIMLSAKSKYIYPDIHPTHQAVLDIIRDLSLSSVCEIGAGCGEVSKYIYNQNSNLAITCVEHNQSHFKNMKEHFEVQTGIMPPDIYVKATLVNDSLPNLALLEDNKYDLVFTCAVMMHIPFIPAVKSAIEMVRISKKYILHVENKNEGNSWYNMAIMSPSTMSSANKVGIDYVRLYENLGVKTLKYAEYKHPDCPGTYVVYLGEKTN